MRRVVIAIVFLLVGSMPASAYWQYAEWGMTPTQVAAASQGHAVPCQAGQPICRDSPGLVIERTQMLGMPASVAFFFFNGEGRLDRTVVTFKEADFALISGLLQGVHGAPVTDQEGPVPVRVFRDTRRGSIITLTGGTPVVMAYRPANQ